MPVRDAYQQTIVAGHDVPDLEVTCRRKQTAVVIIRRVAQQIVVRIHLRAGVQKPDFVYVSQFAEEFDGFAYLNFPSVELHILIHYLPHPGLDALYVFGRQAVFVVFFLEIAIETAGQRVLDVDPAAREDFVGRFAEEEEERALIDALSAGLRAVHIFHVPAVVDPEIKALGDVVHLSGDNLVRLFELKFGKHLKECRSGFKLLVGLSVLAKNTDHCLNWFTYLFSKAQK